MAQRIGWLLINSRARLETPAERENCEKELSFLKLSLFQRIIIKGFFNAIFKKSAQFDVFLS